MDGSMDSGDCSGGRVAKVKRSGKGPIFDGKALAAWRMPGTFCDHQGGGLYLQVRQVRVNGVEQWETKKGKHVAVVTKYWTFRYWQKTRDGGRKLKEFGIGPFNDYTVEEAREIASDQRKIRSNFGDPILERKRRKREALDLIASMKTFEEAAQACWEAHKAKWTAGHAEDWLNSLKTHAYPLLGTMEIRSIRTTHVHSVLQPIWEEIAETASRVRSRIEAVFDFAKGKEWYDADNPAVWDGKLEALLIESPRLKKLVNHPSLPFSQIGAFTEVLRREKGNAARALEFLILTAGRSLEIRGAKGEEFDLERALWTVPAERMKAKKEHVVTLSPRAIEIIRGMGKLHAGKFVFPGGKPGSCLSDAAMNALIKRMDAHRQEKEQKGWCDLKGKRVVPHGFRATFKTWGQDSTDFDRQIIEFALAHGLPDKTEAAYSRGAMIKKRRPLMDSWADYCSLAGSGDTSQGAFRRVKDYSTPNPTVVRVPLP